MHVTAGSRLGPYEIVSPTGAGGMGGGGTQPLWRRDGAELFFISPLVQNWTHLLRK